MDDHLSCGSPDPDTKRRKLFGPEKSREYRRQQKNQRKELQREALSLQRKLAAVQLLKQEEFAQFDAARPHGYLLWRDMADRLQVERRVSEFRQEQLITAIRTQAIYINTIRDIVGKQLSTVVSLRKDGSAQRQRIGSSAGVDKYAGYIQRLDANFQTANEVFRAFGALFASQAQAVHKQVTEGAVEFFSSRTRVVLPLSPLKAGNTLWDIGVQYHSNKEGFVRRVDVQDPDNTLVASFADSSALQTGMPVKMQQHFISRRFCLDNQVIMIWNFISEGMGVFSGLRSHETGYCRLKASADPTEPGAVLEMCICRTPAPSTDTTFAESVKKDFYRVVHKICDEAMDGVVGLAQRALLGNMFEKME